jgi:hypothetical protein
MEKQAGEVCKILLHFYVGWLTSKRFIEVRLEEGGYTSNWATTFFVGSGGRSSRGAKPKEQ